MKSLAAVILSVAFVAGVSGTASAASMSKSDTAMMKKCEAMSHDAMMKNKQCMAMMKKHPDMMKSGSTGSGSMSGSMNSNMKK